MSKRSLMCLVFTIMLVLCIFKWRAGADVPDYRIFVRDVAGADFNLSVSKETENALELKMIPLTSGDYSYTFSLVSRDYEDVMLSSRDYYSYGDEDLKVIFVYERPEAGETLYYTIRADFIPESRYSTRTGEITRSDTENSSCGSSSSSSSIREERINFLPAEFSASAKIYNVNGVTYVAFGEQK